MSRKTIVFGASEDGIATLTINRPDKLNALNSETMSELQVVLNEVQQDASVRALIVTGAGGRAFAAGADISELAEIEAFAASILSKQGQGIFRQLESMAKPSVAAINGFALGAGLELAMSCTFRIATTDARLGQPEVKLGLIPGYGGTQRLPRLVGRGKALELLLTGDTIDASMALRIGLVNSVVDPQDLLSSARTMMSKVLANGPVAVSLVRQAVDMGADVGMDGGLSFESAAFGLAAATNDRKEGTRAFLEKRAPVFTGK